MNECVYRYVADSDSFYSLNLVDPEDYQVLNGLNGKRILRNWRPIKAKLVRHGVNGDFPRLTGHVPVFSKRAAKILSPLLQKSIELLELKPADLECFAINTLNVIDCLDFERSVVEWLDENNILHIEKYVFKPEAIASKHIFRIKQDYLAFTYVSNQFKQFVESADLKGLIFEIVSE